MSPFFFAELGEPYRTILLFALGLAIGFVIGKIAVFYLSKSKCQTSKKSKKS